MDKIYSEREFTLLISFYVLAAVVIIVAGFYPCAACFPYSHGVSVMLLATNFLLPAAVIVLQQQYGAQHIKYLYLLYAGYAIFLIYVIFASAPQNLLRNFVLALVFIGSNAVVHVFLLRRYWIWKEKNVI